MKFNKCSMHIIVFFESKVIIKEQPLRPVKTTKLRINN